MNPAHMGDPSREGLAYVAAPGSLFSCEVGERAGDRAMTGMRRLTALLLAILVLAGSVAYGGTSPPSPKCIAPLKQTQFATQFQLDSYRTAVELYRSCLEDFVKEQEREIGNHRQAAQNAIEEWNRFVGKETKGPPSAPKDKGGQQGGEHQN